MLILILVVLFGAALCSMGGDNSSTVSPVSAEVTAYELAIKNMQTSVESENMWN